MKLKEAIVLEHKMSEQITVQNNIIKDQYNQIFAAKPKAALSVSEIEAEMNARSGIRSETDISPYQSLDKRESNSPGLRKFNEKRAIKNKNKISKSDQII